MVECPRCEGEPPEGGCGGCGAGQGLLLIDRCPKRWISPDIGRLLQLLDFADEGNLPLSGGILDQTQWLLDALSFYRSEKGRLEAEQQKRARQ